MQSYFPCLYQDYLIKERTFCNSWWDCDMERKVAAMVWDLKITTYYVKNLPSLNIKQKNKIFKNAVSGCLPWFFFFNVCSVIQFHNVNSWQQQCCVQNISLQNARKLENYWQLRVGTHKWPKLQFTKEW